MEKIWSKKNRKESPAGKKSLAKNFGKKPLKKQGGELILSELEKELMLEKVGSEEAGGKAEADEIEFSEFVPESNAADFRLNVLSSEENSGSQNFGEPLELEMQNAPGSREAGAGAGGIAYDAPNYSAGYKQAKDYALIEERQTGAAQAGQNADSEISRAIAVRHEPAILFSGEQKPISIRGWQRMMEEPAAGINKSRGTGGAETAERDYQPREIAERKSRSRLPFQQ